MSKIYWFNGTSDSLKEMLSKELYELLKTERRNWRSTVFYTDTNFVDTLPFEYSILSTDVSIFIISSYIISNGNDIVVDFDTTECQWWGGFKNQMKDKLVNIVIGEDEKEITDDTLYIKINKDDTPIDAYTKLVLKLRNENLI
jgi:hypothetical protein